VTYSAKFDGKEYPVDASSSRVALRRVNASTVERTAAGDRSSKETATWTLSADRQELTMVTSGCDATGAPYTQHAGVYEETVARGGRFSARAS
jgi:hypothetical protein